NGALQRWDLATGKPLWAEDFEQGHVGEVLAVAFSADGKRLVSGSADGSVRGWDAATGNTLRVRRAHRAHRPPRRSVGVAESRGAAVDISRDGRWVRPAGSEENLKLFDPATGKQARVITSPPRQLNEGPRQILHLRLSPDGKRAVAIMSIVFYAPRGQEPSGS